MVKSYKFSSPESQTVGMAGENKLIFLKYNSDTFQELYNDLARWQEYTALLREYMVGFAVELNR